MTAPAPPAGFLDQLDAYANRARRAMNERLPGSWTSPDLVDPVLEYPSRGGKGLRPALCLATCEAFGGTLDEALDTAVAIEMMHNAFLIHDDLEDHSELRRGQPTLHRQYGQPLAINAGDALALAAVGALNRNADRLGDRVARRIFDEFDFMSRHTVEGQAIDLGWRIGNKLDLEPGDYLDMIMKKTCWYTTVLPMRAGALIGSRLGADVGPMIDFGFYLGAAFQIQDDLLNLTGDVDRYGKEPLGDIAEGKRTLMLIHVLASAEDDDRSWLVDYLAREREQRSAADTAAVKELMDSCESIEFARDFALGVAASAETAFEAAFETAPPGPARSFVHGLISYMIERDS